MKIYPILFLHGYDYKTYSCKNGIPCRNTRVYI